MGPNDVERVAQEYLQRQGFVEVGRVVQHFNFAFSPAQVASILQAIGLVQDQNTNGTFVPRNSQGVAGFTQLIYGNGAGAPLTAYQGLDAIVADDPKAKVKKDKKKKVGLNSVIISEEKKEEIQAAISQVKNEAIIFDEWGFDEVFEKGTAVSLLFWGIPGTGKTLMAQAIADDTGQKLRVYGNAEIQSSEPGGSERTIKEIFAEAKMAHKKGEGFVVLFDECDSLLMDRNEVGPILGAMVNTLLQEIEHYEGIIIFTTNRMGKLDPALERRISAKIEFEFPDKDARKKIWFRLLPKKAPVAKDVDFAKLADYPLAGGNIKNAVLNAARMAAYQKSKQIQMKHFVDAIEREAKALQAFVSEYEHTSHSSMLGYGRTSTGVSVDQKAEIKPTTMRRIGSGAKGG